MRRSLLASVASIVGLGGCEAAPDHEQGEDSIVELPAVAWCDAVREWPEPWQVQERELAAELERTREHGGRCGTLGFFPPAALAEPDGALQCAARKHALDMSTREYFAHADPEGTNVVARIGEAGYVAAESTELIAAGDVDPARVVDVLWLGSDAHCAALRAAEWQRAGIGYVADDSERGAFWVVVLATEPR